MPFNDPFIVYICTGELRGPPKEIRYLQRSQLLIELRALRGVDDLDLLLQMAECEFYLKRGEEEASMEIVTIFLIKANHSHEYVRTMADNQRRKKKFLPALILYRVSNILHRMKGASGNDAVTWIKAILGNIASSAIPLIKARGVSRDIGISQGLEYMEILLNDLRAVKNAAPEALVLSEGRCLVSITAVYFHADQYNKIFPLCQKGIESLENYFGSRALDYEPYGMLLNNLGTAHHSRKEYAEAAMYYVRALEAKKRASYHGDDNKKLDDIKMTKKNLRNTQKRLENLK